MYGILLIIHSLTRWLVLIFGLAAVGLATRGMISKSAFGSNNNRAGLAYSISMDIQLLLGLLLFFFFSPITTSAFADPAGAMSSDVTRFWLAEHFPLMLFALVLIHVGRSRAKKAEGDTKKHRTALIFYGISFLLILAAIPWPFLSYGRALLPF